MCPMRRTNLEWARDIARMYRSALRVADPAKCADLDARALQRGQRWIAPRLLPAAAADHGMDAVLSAKQIEEFWGVPAATIWGWSSKGLLKNRGRPGAPMYLVKDVFDVEGRHRKPA